MKISKKEDFALLLMKALIPSENGDYIPLSKISKESGMSELFLKQIAHFLIAKKLIISKEGLKGGYKLGKKSSQTTIFEILSAIAPERISPSCDSKKCALKGKNCSCRILWTNLGDIIGNYLRKITLKEFSQNES